MAATDSKSIQKPFLKGQIKTLLGRVLIYRKLLLLNDGRDKIMKLTQYSAKILLWLYLIEDSKAKTRAKAIVHHMSLVRKVIRLAHFLEPLKEAVDLLNEPSNFLTTSEKLAPLNIVAGMINDVSDDIICLAKLGIVDKSWIDKMSPYSDRLWYFTIFLDVQSNLEQASKLKSSLKTGDKKEVEQKLYVNNISLVKLLCDFVFCTIDVFQLDKKVHPSYQILSGFVAAYLGTVKLYLKNK
jgi:hypothetical protein